MRPDVKLGVAISLVIFLVAGVYYLYSDSRDQPVPLSGDRTVAAKPGVGPEPERVKKVAAPGKRLSRKSAGSDSATEGSGGERTPGVTGGASPATDEFGQKKRARRDPSPVRVATTKPNGAARAPIAASTRGAGRPASQPVPTGNVVAGAPGNETGLPLSASRPKASQKTADRTANRVGTSTVRQGTSSAGPSPGHGAGAAARTPQQAGDATSSPAHLAQASPVPAGSNRRDVAVDTHRVQSGDTFASLALAYYGHEKYTRFLIESNPQVRDSRQLKIGAVLKVPPITDIRASASEDRAVGGGALEVRKADQRTYRVEPGDSFYAIARTVLGDASRWGELYALNKSQVGGDPGKLQVGQVLMIPK